MDFEELKLYWIKSAEHDLDVAESLFAAQKYDWCLFVGHLVLEKALKACYVVQNEKFPPKVHDLVRLSELAKVELEEEKKEFLDIVNSFNISTRYPDEKFKFYKICTYDFTKENFKQIKGIFRWICETIDTFKK